MTETENIDLRHFETENINLRHTETENSNLRNTETEHTTLWQTENINLRQIARGYVLEQFRSWCTAENEFFIDSGCLKAFQ